MSSTTGRRGALVRRAPAALVLLAVLGLLLRPLFRPPETVSLDASPAPGAVVGTAPAAVRLDFGSPPDVAAAHVTVARADGSGMNTAALAAAGHGVRAQLPPLREGWYVVTYHVPLADGAQPAGSYAFAVGRPDGPQPPTVTLGETPTAAHAGHGGPIDPVTGVVLAANVVLLVVLGVRLVRHRRPR